MDSVLVVGGGFAGIAAAQALLKSGKVRMTLVDRKNYFEVTPAQLRALVDPEPIGDRSRILYKDLVDSSFIQGEVVQLESRTAHLADGSRLDFDTLVLAPGTRYPRFDVPKPHGQTTVELRREQNRTEHEKFQSASSYLIIGGGLVGVELAGELSSYALGKPIRLVHRGPRLVENLPPKTSALALSQLRGMGVSVLLNTSDTRAEEGELVYETVSPEPMTGFLRTVEAGILDDRFRIRVDPFLRVVGHPHWYAVGDANDFHEGKQAVTALAQGGYAAKTILAQLGAERDPYKPYKAGPPLTIVPLGRKRGFARLPFGTVTWKFLIDIKRKDELVGYFWKLLGYKGA
jgi:NADH dehydrogenase FAD-containing subunit